MLMMTQMIEQRLRFSFTIHLFHDDGIVVYCHNFFAAKRRHTPCYQRRWVHPNLVTPGVLAVSKRNQIDLCLSK